ncbi:PEP-CTERM sorting domain-containing protein [Massilia horti]|uniref:PEP-CTERM sorting domain-containing protein n=1 Tax=Massilia horti TaxID=2562153 RepID=A0A4Y9SZF4_9BURK|nr:PEP-CTERM sorting domain-containing protein [Massilia horti]TFW32277.1 PEP-CTERM sorting domain-containing protein [Massilia horti]
MKLAFSRKLCALALAAGLAGSANAGVLTYQGVTFTSTTTGNIFTLQIDAATHTGDWTNAASIGGLMLKDMGSFSSFALISAPGGTAGWSQSTNELNGMGCGGGTSPGNVCLVGPHVALTDNMIFQFSFTGATDLAKLDTPFIKVNLFDGNNKKAGSLMAQNLAPAPAEPSRDVPEPRSLALMMGGLLAMGAFARNAKRTAK